MLQITLEVLKQIAPKNRKPNLLAELAEWMNYWFPQFEIDTKSEYCHFLAQAAHESDSFNTLKEYGGAKYFARYEGRQDLGNTTKGDGIRYPGRGIFQTTGKTNYQRAEDKAVAAFGNIPEVFFVTSPENLEIPKYAVWSACLYWQDKDFNSIAAMPDSRIIKTKVKGVIKPLSPIEYITYRVNGGFNGFAERKQFYERAKAVIK